MGVGGRGFNAIRESTVLPGINNSYIITSVFPELGKNLIGDFQL